MGEGDRAERDRERGLGEQPPPAFSAWTHACPLTATCPECGLTFDWADLLSISRQRIPWLYEHANHWWDVRRAWGTCFRALAPWWFWKRAQMHHRASLTRLMLLPVVIVVPLWLASAAFVNGMTLAALWGFVPSANPRSLSWLAATNWSWLSPLTKPLGGSWWLQPWGLRWESSGLGLPAPIWTSGAFALIASFTVAAIPSEWRRAGGRPVHLTRAGVYTWAPASMVVAMHMPLIAWEQCSWNSTLSIGWPKPWNPVLGPPVPLMNALFKDPTVLFLMLLAIQVAAWRQALRYFLRLRSWSNVWLVSAGTGALGSVIVALATFGWRWLR